MPRDGISNEQGQKFLKRPLNSAPNTMTAFPTFRIRKKKDALVEALKLLSNIRFYVVAIKRVDLPTVG